MTAESLAESGVGLSPAQLLVEAVGVNDVIAVQAPRTGLQIRRGIQVTDTQRGYIIGDSGCRLKTETGVQLDTIRGADLTGHDGLPRQVGKSMQSTALPHSIAECWLIIDIGEE
jgi:hypothetical protein